MSYNYTQWLAEVANLLGTLTTNANLLIETPNAIDYAEGRIFKDLDLITTITTDATQTTTANGRNVAIPAAFVVVNSVNIITPTSTAPDAGKRNPLTKVSEDFLDLMWPSSAGAALPTLYALRNQTQLILGPWADQNYTVEYVGTQRPTPLSATNPTTFLTTNIPELFLIATMIHLVGYQKNFGAQADDPRSAMSWETQYMKVFDAAKGEELRKRYRGTNVIPPPGVPLVPPAPPAAA
jgi:hypothetical protein